MRPIFNSPLSIFSLLSVRILCLPCEIKSAFQGIRTILSSHLHIRSSINAGGPDFLTVSPTPISQLSALPWLFSLLNGLSYALSSCADCDTFPYAKPFSFRFYRTQPLYHYGRWQNGRRTSPKSWNNFGDVLFFVKTKMIQKKRGAPLYEFKNSSFGNSSSFC